MLVLEEFVELFDVFEEKTLAERCKECQHPHCQECGLKYAREQNPAVQSPVATHDGHIYERDLIVLLVQRLDQIEPLCRT